MKMSYWIEEGLVQYLRQYIPVIFNMDLNRIMQLPKVEVEKNLPSSEKDAFILVKNLLKRTPVEAPEQLERAFSSEYLLKLLSKRTITYPVSR